MIHRKCNECRFFQEGIHSGDHECRYNPPILIMLPTKYHRPVGYVTDAEGHILTQWPNVSRYSWCGKFEAIPFFVEEDEQL